MALSASYLDVEVEIWSLTGLSITMSESWEDGAVGLFLHACNLSLWTTAKALAPILFPGGMDMCFMAPQRIYNSIIGYPLQSRKGSDEKG